MRCLTDAPPSPDVALVSERVLGPPGGAPGGIGPGVVVMRDGRVADVCDRPPAGVPVEDLGDAVLMAGIIDSHVHVNEPGRTEWEGWRTATQAAARGGVSVLADMPLNSSPVTTTRNALAEKLDSMPGKLWVDCALWGGVVPGNAGELAGMVEDGVAGFKAFLCHSGIDDFPAVTADDLRRAMPILAGRGVPMLFHAELEGAVPDGVSQRSVRDYLRWLHARPREWEDRAVAMVLELVQETGCPAHIVHLSSATALPMIRRAKARGLPVTVETCPHYLCLAAEDVPDGATEFKCAPPIRERENQEALWAGLIDGTIDQVVTDHSPCIPSLKLPETGDFEGAWGGIGSLQLGLASVWTEARRRGLGVVDLSRLMSQAPGRLLGLPGALVPGARADLVAWRPEDDFTVHAADLLQRHPLTPYLGRDLHGVVQHTWVRGHRVLRDGVPSPVPHGAPLLRRPRVSEPPVLEPHNG
jgi:allantoinase